MSEAHAEYIDRYLGGFKARWDASPANLAEAVTEALAPFWLRQPEDIADAVLVALGYPGGSPRQETPA